LQQLSYLPHINKHYVYPTTCIIQRQTKPVSVIFVMYFGTSSQVSTCVCKKVVRTESTKKKFTHLKNTKTAIILNCDTCCSETYTKRHSEMTATKTVVYTIKIILNILGMLIPGYLDTRVPCGLPGSRPGSRETSDLPSYRDRLHQSTDCPCGHIQASSALAAAENAERPVY